MNSSPRTLPIACLTLLLLCGALLRGVAADQASTTTPEAAPGDSPVAAAVAADAQAVRAGADPARVAAPTTAPDAAAPTSGNLHFPDGSTRPGLNGVDEPLAPSFTACVPFAPVVGTERDYHGLTWYVHANGVRSTTFRDARGLPFACAYRPNAGKPVID